MAICNGGSLSDARLIASYHNFEIRKRRLVREVRLVKDCPPDSPVNLMAKTRRRKKNSRRRQAGRRPGGDHSSGHESAVPKPGGVKVPGQNLQGHFCQLSEATGVRPDGQRCYFFWQHSRSVAVVQIQCEPSSQISFQLVQHIQSAQVS